MVIIASIANATRELMELYHGQGRLAGAFTMLQRHQQANDSIRNTGIEKDLLKLDFKTEQHADSLLHAQQQQASAHQLERERMNRNLLLAGGVMAIIFGSVSYRQRRRTQRALKRSDELLLNILPEEVAEELKTKGHADAKHFDNVTILFTDFKGFTQLSEKVTPSELVAELNTCFKEFDLQPGFPPYLSLNYRGPAYSDNSKNLAALNILGAVLFSENSTLYEDLVMKDQTVRSLDAGIYPTRDPFLFSVEASLVADSSMILIQNRLLEALGQAKVKALESKKIDQARENIRNSFAMTIDNQTSIAEAFSSAIWLTGDPESLEPTVASIRANHRR